MKTSISVATASIVLYKNEFDELSKLISILIESSIEKIYLIDNSPKDDLIKLVNLNKLNKIYYYHNPCNPGFGAGHNIAIEKALVYSKYHFIINPDVYFKSNIIDSMIDYMEKHSDIGMMMPKILNLDGSIQNLPKLLPSPWSIVLRKLKKPKRIYQKFIDIYELRSVLPNIIYNVPILSGCFTLLHLDAIKKIGMYDDRFFMYFEDWDLSRRMHQHYKTIYYPLVSVYHGYDS